MTDSTRAELGRCTYSIRPHRNTTVFCYEGRITARLGRRCFEKYVVDPAFDPGFAMLLDARGVTEVDASFLDMLQEVRPLATVLRQFDESARAIVLAGSETTFGMARMLGQVLETVCKIHLHVVKNEAEAIHRAGLPRGTCLTTMVNSAG